MEENRNRVLTQISVLSISLVLTCATAINSALPAMKEQLEMTYTQTELITTLPALAVVVFVLWSNQLIRYFGMKRLVQIGLIIVAIAGAAPMFLTDYFWILVSRFLLGTGFGLFNTVAVSLINILYQDEPRRRAILLGYRGAVENLGNAVMSLVAGGLLLIHWHFSFAIYLVALPILLLFTKYAPDLQIKNTEDIQQSKQGQETEMWRTVGFSVLMALFVILGFIAVGVRFPSLVAVLRGTDYPTAVFMAIMPIVSIISGMMFGYLNRVFGQKVLYLGLSIMALSAFLVALGEHSFFCLILGFLISGVPASLVLPFIFNSLDGYVPLEKMNLATSLIIVGCNLGNFLSPFGLQILHWLARSENLFAPFFVMTMLVVIIIVLTYGFATKNTARRHLP